MALKLNVSLAAAVFAALAGMAFDRTPLDAKIETVDDSSPYFRKEKVSFAAAYGNERVPAYLFLPAVERGHGASASLAMELSHCRDLTRSRAASTSAPEPWT